MFQVAFILQNTPWSEDRFANLTMETLDIELGVSKFDLTLAMAEEPDGLVAYYEYNNELFEETTMTGLADHFENLLQGIVADPQQRIYELPLLDLNERRQLLTGFNETTVSYDRQQTLHGLFETQAVKTRINQPQSATTHH